MSFLSILLFASAFYFSHGRPDVTSSNTVPAAPVPPTIARDPSPTTIATEPAATTSSPDLTPTVVDSKEDSPTPDPFADSTSSEEDDDDYQDELAGFIEAMSEAIDEFMLPIMSELTEERRGLVKTMAMNGFGSFYNYIILMYKHMDDDSAEADNTKPFPLDGKDIILSFEALQPIDEDSLLIPALPEDTYNSEEDFSSENDSTAQDKIDPRSTSDESKE